MNNYEKYLFNSEQEEEQQTMELDEFQETNGESIDLRVATDKVLRLVHVESGIELARQQVSQAIKGLIKDLIATEEQKKKVKKAFLELKAKNQKIREEEEPTDYWCRLADYYGE